jgi:hypothetical protein
MKTKVKVTVKTGRKGDAGTLVARIPVTVVRNAQPRGELLYRTRAQLNVHLYKNGQPRARSR